MQTISLILFSAMAAAAVATPVLDRRATALSCPASNGTTYTTTNGGSFTIQCTVDHAGGDLSSYAASSFNDCLNTCSTTSGCIGASFVNTTNYCYMKNATTLPVSSPNVWGAVLQSTSYFQTSADKASCPASNSTTVQTANGLTYVVGCGQDHNGGDLSNSITSTFGQCIKLCSTTSSCIAVAYTSSGFCYLKSSYVPASSSSSVNSAVLSTVQNSQPAAYTCPTANNTIVASNGRSAVIQCYQDHYGGDLATVFSYTLNSCISSCASNSSCVALSYVSGSPGPCYLKSSVQTPVTSNSVWGAVFQ